MDEKPYTGEEHARLSEIFNSIVGKAKYDKQNYTQITRQFTSASRLNDNEIYIIFHSMRMGNYVLIYLILFLLLPIHHEYY